MVTGDNLLTAMSVARECGILNSRRRTFIVEVSNETTIDGCWPKLITQQAASSSIDDNNSNQHDYLSSLLINNRAEADVECNSHSMDAASYQLAISGK
jgi:magnesium-transporting ATPase (P-type)